MRTTIFRCDRCGKEDQTNDISIINVGVHVGGYAKQYSSFDQEKTRLEYNQEWCKDCRIRTGLIEKPKDSTLIQVPLTIEDLVREIAYESACDAIANRR